MARLEHAGIWAGTFLMQEFSRCVKAGKPSSNLSQSKTASISYPGVLQLDENSDRTRLTAARALERAGARVD